MMKDRPAQLFTNIELNEYMIIVLPYAEINNEVKNFKREFFKKYGPYSGQNSCAHIGLMSFFQTADREEKLMQSVQEVVGQLKGFEVFLNGFEFDSNQRSVYVDILNKQSLEGLYHQLRLRLFKDLVSLAFLNKNYTPMMKIGQNLSPLQFLDAITDNKARAYTNNFRVTRLHVLKRKAPYTTWESLAAVPFARAENELMGLH
ncbi:MAG: 2'-5' RNA ligase family protein [Roseivirga sp.]|uniref:2'-5' RNA ligase family protein n=1 Tax=Roseivirga sp. TaxID=1964215 RepID=UPI001B2ECA68|nr:2'-5' RNA ligase family protein [Roseivirga sp.]MBO6659957.1 2'-5' RNA ligase family protein [Roseivirga sp.]MBO6907306.1 2'-5' RNA ligase family protein [Roseivirga sp.]